MLSAKRPGLDDNRATDLPDLSVTCAPEDQKLGRRAGKFWEEGIGRRERRRNTQEDFLLGDHDLVRMFHKYDISNDELRIRTMQRDNTIN